MRDMTFRHGAGGFGGVRRLTWMVPGPGSVIGSLGPGINGLVITYLEMGDSLG